MAQKWIEIRLRPLKCLHLPQRGSGKTVSPLTYLLKQHGPINIAPLAPSAYLPKGPCKSTLLGRRWRPWVGEFLGAVDPEGSLPPNAMLQSVHLAGPLVAMLQSMLHD